MSKNIGIIGVGMVGGAMYEYYPDATPYDIERYPDTKEEAYAKDFLFICVPTPHKEGVGCDTSIVEQVLSELPDGKTVILRSTIIPGTTDRLQEQFPNLHVLFNPEFLDEVSAAENFAKPNRQIVGYTEKSKEKAESVLDMLPEAPFKKLMPAQIAETVKYFGNSFYASKVVFANQIFDLCEKLDLDYDLVKEAVAHDPRIGPSHLEIFHKGYRGYGGKCLPKDVKALIHLARSNDLPLKYLELVDELNEGVRATNPDGFKE